MSYLFWGCESLKALPHISNWNTSNIIDISYMFHGCKSLISLPGIFNWKTNKALKMEHIIDGCYSLIINKYVKKLSI